jgi:hypothetical protein
MTTALFPFTELGTRRKEERVMIVPSDGTKPAIICELNFNAHLSYYQKTGLPVGLEEPGLAGS